ncbi:MAG: helix-turn-helix domain-containing protein [Desulfovibrionaceae bacterium]
MTAAPVFIKGKAAIARRAGVSERTLERWIAELGFPAKFIDGRWRVTVAAMEKWFDEQPCKPCQEGNAGL